MHHMRRWIYLGVFFGISGLGLLVIRSEFSRAAAQARLAEPPVIEGTPSYSLLAPEYGNAAEQGDHATFYKQPGITGRAIYATDRAKWQGQQFAAGIPLFLVVHSFGQPFGEANLFRDPITSFRVTSIQDDFLVQPTFSPDGRHVAYRLGDNSSEYGAYTLHICDLSTRQVITIETPENSVYTWPVYWSHDGRFLAYFRGGNPIPFGGRNQLELWVFELQTLKNTRVAADGNLLDNIAWTPDNRIMYSIIPMPTEMAKGKMAFCFLYDPSRKRATVKVLDDAIHPTPSPNGKYVAAFSNCSTPYKERQRNDTKGSLLSKPGQQRTCRLFPTTGEQSIIIHPTADFHDSYLLWAADSSEVYRVKLLQLTETRVRAEIYDYAVKTKIEKRVGIIEYTDQVPDAARPTFTPLCVSKDNTRLFYSLLEEGDTMYEGRKLWFSTLNYIEIATGKASIICRVRYSGPVDWYDASTPEQSSMER